MAASIRIARSIDIIASTSVDNPPSTATGRLPTLTKNDHERCNYGYAE